ncbi:MAG: YitT family protein [Chloroflexi bacterium]|nr:YitT family protein [Chloroflexota bacterium]
MKPMTASSAARWRTVRDYAYLTAGTVILALAMVIFLIPGDLAAGGVSGLALVVHHYTGWPVGALVTAFNLPLFALGWRYLGGPRFALRTLVSVLLFSAVVDGWTYGVGLRLLTDDMLLNALYGGVVGGVGAGLIYRGRGTSGGTDILARILARRMHIPMAQSYLLSDALVLAAAGFTFGWEKALYALVTLYITGLTADAVSQGANVVRTALIVTARPEAVTQRILRDLDRGVTVLQGRGGYTGQPRAVLYCVVSRGEVGPLKAIVREADPRAFMVIGHAYEALGEGFKDWEEA